MMQFIKDEQEDISFRSFAGRKYKISLNKMSSYFSCKNLSSACILSVPLWLLSSWQQISYQQSTARPQNWKNLIIMTFGYAFVEGK